MALEKFKIEDFKGRFFEVIKTTDLSQLAVMTIGLGDKRKQSFRVPPDFAIGPGGDGGPAERHDADQIIFVLEGEAEVTVEQEKEKILSGELVVIDTQKPKVSGNILMNVKGKIHHVKSAGKKDLFFLTVYSPPAY